DDLRRDRVTELLGERGGLVSRARPGGGDDRQARRAQQVLRLHLVEGAAARRELWPLARRRRRRCRGQASVVRAQEAAVGGHPPERAQAAPVALQVDEVLV